MADKLFTKLTKLFRSGPIVRRKVKNSTARSASSVLDLFQQSHSNAYAEAMGSYGSYDRMSRYSDGSEMIYVPEIATALNIYADESVAQDDKGRCLHVFSEHAKIRSLLEDLFYDTLNVEFNLRGWVKNLCKYGDFFTFLDVQPGEGIINVFPMPVNEVEREEGYDPEDPLAVRFRWVTQKNAILENWQVAHFRLLGNDAFLPYGTSVLEGARKIWRQLVLIEDAMLVYRVVRSPERRVFYVDVSNVSPEDVPTYMQRAKAALKTNEVVDRSSGKIDLRNAPLTVLHDYFLPTRGNETATKIETLPGGTHQTAIDDVKYIRDKLVIALGVPRAYLGLEEGASTSKATLASLDVRFSRSIQHIQKTIVAELNKIAIVHLFSNGFEGEDLLNFTLHLSNPSAIAQQQKLELYRTKLEIAGTMPEGLVSRKWVLKNVVGLTDEEIERIDEDVEEEKMRAAALEGAGASEDEALFGGGGGGLGGGGGPPGLGAPTGGPPVGPAPEEGGEGIEKEEENPDEELFAGKEESGTLLTDVEEDPKKKHRLAKGGVPVKANPMIQRALYNRSRRRTHGASKTHMPDYKKMMSPSNKSFNDPHDRYSVLVNPLNSSKLRSRSVMNEANEDVFDRSVSEVTKLTYETHALVRSLESTDRTSGDDATDSYAGPDAADES